MIVTCLNCQAENHLPELIDRKNIYYCSVCRTKFDAISSANYGIVTACILVAWSALPILVWTSRPLIETAKEYSIQAWIGNLMLWSPLSALPFVLLATTYYLLEGLRHRKFTGISPKGFHLFAFLSLLGGCICITAIIWFVRTL
jgi:hypothetical protein